MMMMKIPWSDFTACVTELAFPLTIVFCYRSNYDVDTLTQMMLFGHFIGLAAECMRVWFDPFGRYIKVGLTAVTFSYLLFFPAVIFDNGIIMPIVVLLNHATTGLYTSQLYTSPLQNIRFTTLMMKMIVLAMGLWTYEGYPILWAIALMICILARDNIEPYELVQEEKR